MSKFYKNLIAATAIGLTILSNPIVAGNVQYGSNDDFTDSIPTDRLPEALRHAQDEVEEARKYDYKIRQEISDDRLKMVESAIKAREDKAAQEISDERLKMVESAIKAGEDPIKAIEARDKAREEREERVKSIIATIKEDDAKASEERIKSAISAVREEMEDKARMERTISAINELKNIK